MFGKRAASEPTTAPARPAERVRAMDSMPPVVVAKASSLAPILAPSAPQAFAADNRSEGYYQIKATIFSALIDTIDLAQLAQLDPDSAREEIRDIVNEIISIKAVVMSIAEQEQ